MHTLEYIWLLNKLVNNNYKEWISVADIIILL